MNKYSFYCRRTGIELEATLDEEDGKYILLADFNKFRAKLLTAIDENEYNETIETDWLRDLINSDISL